MTLSDGQGRRLRRVGGPRQGHAHRREAELCNSVAPGWMALPLGPLDVGARRQRDFAPHGELRRRGNRPKSRLFFTGKSPVLERANDKRAPCLDQGREQRVRIPFAIGDVNRSHPSGEVLLSGIDPVSPALGLAEPLGFGPVLVPDPLLEAKHRLQGQQAERAPRAIGVEHQGEVPEETLRRGLDQMPQPRTLALAAEFERCRVMDHNDPRQRCGTTCGLPEVRGEDRFRRDLIIGEEAIRRLQPASSRALGKLSPGRSLRLSANAPSRRVNRVSPRSASPNSDDMRMSAATCLRTIPRRDHAPLTCVGS